MKISEMIRRLQEAQAKVGDVPVAMPDELEVLDISVNDDAVFVSDRDEDGNERKYWREPVNSKRTAGWNEFCEKTAGQLQEQFADR